MKSSSDLFKAIVAMADVARGRGTPPIIWFKRLGQRGFGVIGIILVAVVGVTGCANTKAAPPVRSLIETRHDKTVIQKWDLSCGAAALATLLKFQQGEHVSEQTIAKELIAREEYLSNPNIVRIREGFSLLDLKRYLNNHGYDGVGLGQMTLDDLVERAPVIVPINQSGYNHFVIFRGLAGNRTLLADPAWGNRTLLTEKFERAWIDYGEQVGKVGFVVKRRDGIPPPNQLAPALDDFVTLG
jgi:uncharacterized protein